ncbi:MAG: hypothetical protein ACXWVG_15845 [Telluria sp.]
MKNIAQNADAISNVVKSFDNLVDAWKVCSTTASVEKTNRARIRKDRDVQVRAIEENSAILKTYLKKIFEERALVIDGMFTQLDQGLSSGNMELASLAINAIVSVTKSSPLEGARDLIADLRNPNVSQIEI